jgi:ABC-type nitrate/sulfonate/bicarbonate transport system ATPase subunit
MSQCTYGKTLLEVKDVCLDYQGKAVLRNVNAKITDIIRTGTTTGQIVGFLGPSGIGKTQLFRIIAGLNKPTSGSVHIGESINPVIAGEVGVVAQSYPLFEHRTVFSNLMVAASHKEKDSKVAKDKVLEYLNQFELADKRTLYPSQLSGGQRQRAAIIQQVLCSEHFLLMDEPFSGLDLLMLEKTCALLSKVAHMHEFNTIVVVTHDVTAAASISDHLWMMGRERDAAGQIIPGAKIMKEYSLVDRDLCWHPGIITTQRFTDFVSEVKNQFRNM